MGSIQKSLPGSREAVGLLRETSPVPYDYSFPQTRADNPRQTPSPVPSIGRLL